MVFDIGALYVRPYYFTTSILTRLPRSPIAKHAFSVLERLWYKKNGPTKLSPLAHGDYTAHTNLAC